MNNEQTLILIASLAVFTDCLQMSPMSGLEYYMNWHLDLLYALLSIIYKYE